MLLQEKRIFVVEDNSENRIVMKMVLTKQGATLCFENYGAATLQKLKEFAPVDLIILDLMLGRGVTGYKILETIRAHSEYAHIPVVAVSAAEPSEAIPMCMQKKFNGFIAKPIDNRLFPQQLAKILEGEHIWYAGGFSPEIYTAPSRKE